jgi:hypothetical protein
MEWPGDIPHDPDYPMGNDRDEDWRDKRSSNKPVDPDNWSDDDITGG